MSQFTNGEIISTLYAERDRLSSIQSSPGWSNWAVIAAILSIVVYLFDLIVEKRVGFSQYQLMLFSTLGVATAILAIVLYEKVTSRSEVYYTNRVSTVWDEGPILDLCYWAVIYVVMLSWYSINGTFNFTFYVVLFFVVTRVIMIGGIIINRNRLVPAGMRYNIMPNMNTKLKSAIWLIDFISVPICLSICPIILIGDSWSLFTTEIKIASSITAVAILIYMFLKLNSKSQNVINELDGVIDRVLYGGLSSDDAIEQLKCIKYGGNCKQTVQSELGLCISSIQKLTETEQILDNAFKAIKDKQINPQNFDVYLKLHGVVLKDLKSANVKCDTLQKKVHKMILLPNSVKFLEDLNDLNGIVQSAIDKTTEVIEKATEYKSLLEDYVNEFYCRHSGGLCETLDCANRQKAMSVKYALKKYPFWTAVKIIYHDRRKNK